MFWFILEVPIALIAVITNSKTLAQFCQSINTKRRLNAEPFLSVNSLRDKPEGMSKVRYAEWCIFTAFLEIAALIACAAILWLICCAAATYFHQY